VSEPQLRRGRPSDVDDVAHVCLLTAQHGEAATARTVDADLVADVYARPYLLLEPATCRVLVVDDAVVGYVVGALDSAAFYRRWQQEWAPLRLPRPEGADPALVHLLTTPHTALPEGVRDYPSHLHVNLLPQVRGGGWGRRLVVDFMAGLRAAGSPGVHLVVDPANTRAITFYERLGFRPRTTTAATVVMALPLDPPWRSCGSVTPRA
jgi:ribosomal protein S18 acetylase RimI-like enzyme